MEDFAACKEIMGYRYPETLVEAFLKLDLPKDAKIIDVACGAGNIPYLVSYYLITFKTLHFNV